MSTINVILVEDNAVLREELQVFLTDCGWPVRAVSDGLELDLALRQASADIAILDLNLPFEDGISIAQRLRRAYPLMGIVMLTARVRPSDRTEGYQSGADVYLTKPASVQELRAVIQTLGNRITAAAKARAAALVMQDQAEPVGSRADFELDVKGLLLRQPRSAQECNEMSLTPVEAQVLQILAQAGGQVVDSLYLIELLRDTKANDTDWEKSNLSVMMSRLRTKAQLQFGVDLSIKSVRNQGYQWAARAQLSGFPPLRE